MRGISLWALALAFLVQDPATRPTTRASRPAPQPATRPTNPLLGFWEARAVVGPPPSLAARFRGYLAIGERHLSLHLIGPGPDPEIPFFQSGFRTYRVEGDRLITTSVLGVTNRVNGSVLIENAPLEETRTFTRLGPHLRIQRSAGEYIDFVKIE